MLKRTTGRLLLTLLVTTGLAGTINNGSISQKERKQAITLMKTSRAEVLNSIKGLSAKQLKYKTSSKDPSISELVMCMVSLEKKCSDEIRTIMTQPSNTESRLQIALTDDQLLANNNYAFCKTEMNEKDKAQWKDAPEAMKHFATLRDHHIKYIRSSTEGLRNHVVKTPAGWIDCYQYYLLIADRSSYFTDMINKIKSSPRFPKK